MIFTSVSQHYYTEMCGLNQFLDYL